MHKTTKLLAIIAAIVLALGLILCAGAVAAADDGLKDAADWLTIPVGWLQGSDRRMHLRVGGAGTHDAQTMTYTAQSPVSALELSVTSHDTELRPVEGLSAVRLTYTQTRNDQFTITEEGGRLVFRENAAAVSIGFSFNSTDPGKLLVEYPAGQTFMALTSATVSGDLVTADLKADRIEIATTSGDIRTGVLTSDSFSLVTVSGASKLGGVRTGKAKLASTSGDMELALLEADSADIGTISGQVKAAAACGELKITTTSGDMELTADCGTLKTETISGKLELKLTPAAYRTEISTVSGDARIAGTRYDSDELPFKGKFTLNADGSFTSGTPDGARTLILGSTSGDFSIKLDK